MGAISLPTGMLRLPRHLLQVEEPLPFNILLFLPLNQKVVTFRPKGHVLTLAELSEILEQAATIALVTDIEVKAAMEQVAATWVSLKEGEDGPPTISQKAEAGASTFLATAKPPPFTPPAEKKTESLLLLDESAKLVQCLLDRFKEISQSRSFDSVLNQIAASGDPLEQHHRYCASLSVLVLLALGNSTVEEATDLATAALIHDESLRDLDPSFLRLHLAGDSLASDFTAQPYAEHMGASALKFATNCQASGMSPTRGALKTVQQHHENFDGSGPLELKGSAIYRLARILRIVDDWVCLVQAPGKDYDLETAFLLVQGTMRSPSQRGFYEPQLLTTIYGKMFAV